MKWLEMEQKLAACGLKLFTDKQFKEIVGCSASAAKFMLIRCVKKGFLTRLKRGLYASPTRAPSAWAVANRLRVPSYVSCSSALSYYGLIPETVYAVGSITTKSTREFKVNGAAYIYRSVRPGAFGHYRLEKIGGAPVLIAEKEKALADYFYFTYLDKAPLNERLRFHGINEMKLKKYLNLNLKLIEIVGWCTL